MKVPKALTPPDIGIEPHVVIKNKNGEILQFKAAGEQTRKHVTHGAFSGRGRLHCIINTQAVEQESATFG